MTDKRASQEQAPEIPGEEPSHPRSEVLRHAGHQGTQQQRTTGIGAPNGLPLKDIGQVCRERHLAQEKEFMDFIGTGPYGQSGIRDAAHALNIYDQYYETKRKAEAAGLLKKTRGGR